jgi:flagellar biosynthesis/type III secretory pathway protein FliH
MGLLKKGSFVEKKTIKLGHVYENRKSELGLGGQAQEIKNSKSSSSVSDNSYNKKQYVSDNIDYSKQYTEDKLNPLKQEKSQIEEEIIRLKTSAQSEIDALKEQALIDSENIRENAKKEGYDAGFKETSEKYTAKIEALGKEINGQIITKKEILKQTEGEILKLSTKIAEQLIKSEISLNQAVALNIVTEAISKITDRDKVVVKVSNNDYEYVHNHKESIVKLVDDVKNLTIQEDPSMEAGGCIIETDLGYIDSRISIKLDAIQNALQTVHKENMLIENDSADIKEDVSFSEEDEDELKDEIYNEENEIEEIDDIENNDDSIEEEPVSTSTEKQDSITDVYDTVEEDNKSDEFFDFDNDETWE